MNVCHGFLNALQVSTPELEKMINIARSNGAIGAKLTGAGGGGSIVALCPGEELEKKRLWPLFWSNTCCSHPRKGESMEIATRRRLKEELNIEASLECIYKFSYQARFGELGSENELCSVYLGRTTQDFSANKDEIADARYVSWQVLQNKLQVTPEAFTPWFKMEWKQLCSEFTDKLNAYTRGN